MDASSILNFGADYMLAGGSLTGTPLTGAGQVTVAGGVTLTFDSGSGFVGISGVTLTVANGATVAWASGDIHMDTGATLVNNGTFDAESDNTITTDPLCTTTFINNGTLEKTGGTGTTTIDGNFTNNGTIDAVTGSFSFPGCDPPQAPAARTVGSYVASAFEGVLHRAPDESALAYWSGQLAGGLSPGQFAGDLTHSAEFYATNVIAPAYETYLGRAPDAAGVAYWTSQMQHGMTDQQIEAHFIASPEFYAHAGGTNAGWVNALYQAVLGRSADRTGMSHWLGQLSAGASRSTIALGFAASPEREAQMIQDDYFSYLGRAAGASELNYWLAQFEEGATNEDILSGFIGSSEYVQSH